MDPTSLGSWWQRWDEILHIMCSVNCLAHCRHSWRFPNTNPTQPQTWVLPLSPCSRREAWRLREFVKWHVQGHSAVSQRYLNSAPPQEEVQGSAILFFSDLQKFSVWAILSRGHSRHTSRLLRVAEYSWCSAPRRPGMLIWPCSRWSCIRKICPAQNVIERHWPPSQARNYPVGHGVRGCVESPSIQSQGGQQSSVSFKGHICCQSPQHSFLRCCEGWLLF